MKTNLVTDHDVVVQGAQQSGNFTIAANGKAFKILIDGLYSNKIKAIVRELSSNAFDAHIAAGRPEMPFELHLPNLLDPTFTIRDFGTSLRHEDIMGLYTTVFMSTKEDTNNAIGKFGLGSKTPFAYTDNFTVTAFLRGTKRVYGAYIDVTGIPTISLMASEDTSELDGLMVSFPVNVKDCNRFVEETQEVLAGFDIKPIVKGAEIETVIFTPIYEGSNFKILEDATGPMARQGCVIYPIDVKALSDLSATQKNILASDILIDFPIGQVDITPSRESLSYDDQTIQNILDMADQIDNEITASLKVETAKAKTLFETQALKHKYLSMDIKSAESFAKKMTWNGKPVALERSFDRSRIRKTHGVYIDGLTKSYYSERKSFRFSHNSVKSAWVITSKTIFVYEPIGAKRASSRLRHLVDTNPMIDNVVWIKQAYSENPVNRRRLLKLIGYAELVNINDLPLPEKTKRDRAEPISRQEMRVNVYSKHGAKHSDVITIAEDNYHYVTTYNAYIVKPDGTKVYQSELFSFMNFLGIEKEGVIVLTRKQAERVAKFDNWTPIFSEENYAKLEEAVPFDSYYLQTTKNGALNHWIKNYNEYLDFSYGKDTSWKKVLDILHEKVYDEDDDDKDSDLIRLYRNIMGGAKANEREKLAREKIDLPSVTLDAAYKQFLVDYPMAKFFKDSYYNREEEIPFLLDYIKLVDERNEKNV